MDTSVILWIFGTVIGVMTMALAALAGALWGHVGHCKDTAADVAGLKANYSRMSQDIGTHDTGLRGQAHHIANTVDAMEKRLFLLEHVRGLDR